MDNSILRKTFIKRASLGSAALTSLLNESSIGSIKNKVAPKCKRVIVLCMAGGPSHLETFDFKPKLKEYLNSVLKGIKWYSINKIKVKKNQFGTHPWFT